MSCYCDATPMPPCAWCERTFECERCGELRNTEDCEFGLVDGMMFCGYCLEDHQTNYKDVFEPKKCTCQIFSLMNFGCKCGGT